MIAALNGFAPSASFTQESAQVLMAAGSALTASMLRDIEHGAPVEGEQILGDVLRRAGAGVRPRSLLKIACAHVRAYEARRVREARAGGGI